MPDTIQVPYLKPDAKLQITIGTKLIHDIQHLYEFLLLGKTKEDAARMKQKIDNKQPLEPWEMSVITITNFLKFILEEAKHTDQLEYHSLEDTIKSAIL